MNPAPLFLTRSRPRVVAQILPLLALFLPNPCPGAGQQSVSYYRDVRPILQANCQGCHQPAKAKGGFVMTDFKKLLAGGDDEGHAVEPGKPDKSSLLKMVKSGKDGPPRMPKGKSPLATNEIAVIRVWIEQGAADDTPADAKPHFDTEHPPKYSRPPVIASIDYSPDGSLLAVSGFHEVLLHQADGSGMVGRLVGLSERVQSLRFSPDGKRLAVAGGDPARLGEIQVWDVAQRRLLVSSPITYDTLYGVSWSPDGQLIAFGGGDNTVRAIDANSGKPVLQMGSHSDWAVSTSFSLKGDHIISGGRDMTVKLTEVASQRFIDNITSITPGALKGGVLAVATHPTLEHVVAAGSDGLPKVYRIFRETKREIGDDAQFIAELFPMPGRVFSVRFSADGRRIVCGSSLDGTGEILVCSYDYTNDVPKNIRDIMGKVPGNREPEERKQLSDYGKQGIRELARTAIPVSTVYSVAFAPDGKTIAAGGSDGNVRFFDSANGALMKMFSAAPVATNAGVQMPVAAELKSGLEAPNSFEETLPSGVKVVGLDIHPSSIQLESRNDYVQILAIAKLDTGDQVDVTRMAQVREPTNLVQLSARGLMRPWANGVGTLVVSFQGQSLEAKVEVHGQSAGFQADFIKDVSPVIAKLGCNAGTCHGAKDGKNGFKLSLRGYDPVTDLRALTDDLASRRVDLASPDDSLMLLKARAEVPHEGGRRTTVTSPYYQILRQWIVNGAKLDTNAARVIQLDLFPPNPVVQKLGGRQQFRIVAAYSDGTHRDVTAEAVVDSGNADVATVDTTGLATTLRRGEAPILARYQGNYAATTLTVMGDRSDFVWEETPVWNKIDELVSAKWKRMKIKPSDLCTELEFIRRIYLDLTGLPPGPEDIHEFLMDPRPSKDKRYRLIDSLIGSPEYVDHWANKWADLLQCNSKFLGQEGAESLRAWIRTQIEKNIPYDQFAREILTASGSNKDNPAASYWKILRTPTEAMENTTHLFLATRFNCNKCHDHPFEKWTQDQYYQTAAFFAQVSLKEDPASKGVKIGGTEVEGAKPLYEIVSDVNEGEVRHDRTGKVTPPAFPFSARFAKRDAAARREQLAAWITSPDNRYFASSYVNRLWGYLTGVGIIEPLDDIRAGNPPKNPELLEYLTLELIKSGFDTRHVVELICKSRCYQLSLTANKWNEDDKVNYSHAIARRLPAETLFDSVFKVTGAVPNIPGAKPGQRACQLSDANQDVASGLLATLGRPARQSACECERSSDIRLGSVMALLSGPTISEAINNPTNALAKLEQSEKDNAKLIDNVFFRILNRPATEKEVAQVLGLIDTLDQDHAKLTNELAALETKMAPAIAELQQKRDRAISWAKTNLAVYDDFTRNLRAELDRRRNDQIAVANRELKDYETLLPGEAGFWELRTRPADTRTIWNRIDPWELSATGDTKLTRQKDGSILASGANNQSDYRLVTQTSLTNVTGIMLEVLPDDSLPRFGPGRKEDANFVLSEFELKWASGTNTPETGVKFVDARADYSQPDYSISQAIDGKVEAGRNGWAIGGAPGTQRHVATFKLEHPLADTNGLSFRFKLLHHYADGFNIGRFRIFLTASPEPLEFGMPETVVLAARAPAGQRTPEQAAALIDYYRSTDTEFWKRKLRVQSANEPLPRDPKLAELENALTLAEEPVHLDPYLVQLREAFAASSRQGQNKRLTMVQDLAWALINSSPFLFNH